MKIGVVAPGIWNSIHLDMVGAGPWVKEVDAAPMVPGHDPEAWGRAIEASFAGVVASFAGGAIAAQPEPRRIAAMLVERGREIISRPA